MMLSNRSISRPPRAIFFGMQGTFSSPSLMALLENGIEVCAVVVPTSPVHGGKPAAIQRKERPRFMRSILPMAAASVHPSILEMAWKRGIPLWEVSRLASDETRETLAAYQPDVICVACFSLLIPQTILSLPRLGCLNVHPSLLPENRGPEPLFWTFRKGCDTTGVTVHLMNEKLDSGDILAQTSIAVPEGISYSQLERLCAGRGGELLARAVWDLYEGRAVPVPQDEAKSSYHPFPAANDFVVQAEAWSAQHVYNFVRGVIDGWGPIELRTADERLFVHKGISYSLDEAMKGSYDGVGPVGDGEYVVRCRDGWVWVKGEIVQLKETEDDEPGEPATRPTKV